MAGLHISALVASVALCCLYPAVEGGGEGREFAVDALTFKAKHGKFLSLGDCVAQGGVTADGLRMQGSPVFLDNKHTSLQFHRINTMLDSYHKTMAGVSQGIDFCGLIGGEVEGTVTVTVKTKRNTVTMEAKLQVSRGVDTLRDATPNPNKSVRDFKDNCPYYLSEIVYGGWERMFVHFMFETVETTTEFELKVTIKVLFFKISVKMRFLFVDVDTKGIVKVIKMSSTGAQDVKEYSMSDPSERTLAFAKVEDAEREMADLPRNINSIDKTQLHETYFFAKAVIDNSYTPGLLSNQWAYRRAKYQAYELSTTLTDIDEDLSTRTASLSSSDLSRLRSLQSEVRNKKTDMDAKLASFRGGNAEIDAMLGVYGSSRAPGYYQRKHKEILPELEYLVCANKGISTSGLPNLRGISLKECGQNCNTNPSCKAYVWKANGSICYLYNRSTCPAVSNQSGTTYVGTERMKNCSLSGCTTQAFVQ